MILIQSSRDYFADSTLILTTIKFFATAVEINENNIKTQFLNKNVTWNIVPYVFTYDFKLRMKINSDTISNYKTLFIKTFFISRITNKEIEVPFLVIKDIKKTGIYKESIVENIDNWLEFDMGTFDIFCRINYYDANIYKNGTTGNSEILNRHFHNTGTVNESYKIRDVFSNPNSLAFQYGYKSIFSRGDKSFILKV